MQNWRLWQAFGHQASNPDVLWFSSLTSLRLDSLISGSTRIFAGKSLSWSLQHSRFVGEQVVKEVWPVAGGESVHWQSHQASEGLGFHYIGRCALAGSSNTRVTGKAEAARVDSGVLAPCNKLW